MDRTRSLAMREGQASTTDKPEHRSKTPDETSGTCVEKACSIPLTTASLRVSGKDGSDLGLPVCCSYASWHCCSYWTVFRMRQLPKLITTEVELHLMHDDGVPFQQKKGVRHASALLTPSLSGRCR